MLIKAVIILGIAQIIYGQAFNSNPRQQDHSGSHNLQVDLTSTGTQYIGPRVSRAPGGVSGVNSELITQAPAGTNDRKGLFNSNPRQQDHSGGDHLQIDTTSTGRQYIGPKPSESSVVPLTNNEEISNSIKLVVVTDRIPEKLVPIPIPKQEDEDLATDETRYQYIGYPGRTPIGSPRYGVGFNSNPRQQDYSGGGNVQIDTSGTSRQYIGSGQPYPARYGRRAGFQRDEGTLRNGGRYASGGRYGGNEGRYDGNDEGYGGNDGGYGRSDGSSGRGYGSGPRVQVNGVDYTGQNVQEPGLHINQNPYY